MTTSRWVDYDEQLSRPVNESMAPGPENAPGPAVASILKSLTTNTKASIAPPKVTANTTMELENISSVEDKLPLHEDIMQLARLGEISPIKRLFDEGKFSAKFRDEEGITPLHVCARQEILPQTRGESLLISGDLVGSDQQSLCTLQIFDRIRRRY